MRLYDQNIWGNFSVADHCVANRNLLIKEMIEELEPEICCFQECNPATSRSGETPIQEILKPGFIEVLPEYANRNFTPVFYNPDKVELLDGGYFPFEGLNDIDSKSVTWGVFKEKASDKIFSVASVHFWWMSRGEKDNLQRRENAKDVGKLAKKLYERYNAPVLVTGDLNSGNTAQGTGGYDKMIELGMKDIRCIARETDDGLTCSGAYPVLKDGIYTECEERRFTIDYMFVCGEEMIDAKKFSVINTPKAKTSSDHSPLVFDFEIK